MMELSATTVLPPSELGNPQRTRVFTFPQRRRLRLSNWAKMQPPANRTFLQTLLQNQFY
jgi:hypothetical protein